METRSRRTTTGVLSESNWNTQMNASNSDGFEKPSKILAPSTRMSVGGPGAAGGLVVGRASMLPPPTSRLSMTGNNNYNSVNQLSQDMSAMNLGGRKSLGGAALASASAGRRTSNVDPAGGRPSMDRQSFSRRSSLKGPGGAPLAFKDPRPIRDKQFQQAAVKSLVKFLIDAGINEQVSAKTLLSPSGKEFQKIFVFLYRFFEPNYNFVKRFEDEVPALVRAMRYPFPNDIGKSQLCAVGTPHTWPTVLVMLTWMVELILCQEQINPEIFEVEQEENAELFHNFVISAYEKFLAGDQTYEQSVADLDGFFAMKNAQTLEETNELAAMNEALVAELESLTQTESPLIALENQKNVYANDIEKFKQYISRVEIKTTKLSEAISHLQADVDATVKEMDEYEKLKLDLQAQVDAQPMSPEDIDRLNSEKEHLSKSLESLNETREELNKSVWDREMSLQKKIDVVEKTVQQYHTIGEQLGMIPLDAKNSSGINFEISLKMHETKAETIAPVDFKNVIKPSLSKWRNVTNDKFHATEDQNLVTSDSFDRLQEAISDKTIDVSTVEERLKRMQEQYSEEKEKFVQEGKVFNVEMESLEAKIRKTTMENSNSLLLSEQNLQKTKIDHDNLVREIEEEQEAIAAELFQISEEIIEFKNRKNLQIEAIEVKIRDESQLTESMGTL